MSQPQTPREALRNATEGIRKQRAAAEKLSRDIQQQRRDAETSQPETPTATVE